MADSLERFTWKVNTVLISMSLLPWSTMDHVGDCSSYVVQLAMLFEQESALRPDLSRWYMKKMGAEWCRTLCLQSTVSVCGAQQMLNDVHAIKAMLVSFNQRRDLIEQSFSKVERTLQFVLSATTDDANVLEQFYVQLFANTDYLFYDELLRLKGVGLAERLRLTNSFERNWSQNPSYFATSKLAKFFVDMLG